jgi:hypothetical protein
VDGEEGTDGRHAVLDGQNGQIEGAGARLKTTAYVQRTDRENSKILTATHDTLSTHEQLSGSHHSNSHHSKVDSTSVRHPLLGTLQP